MRKQILLLFTIATAAALSFAGCGGGDDPPVPVAGVSLNKTSLSLRVGTTETLLASVLPENAALQAVTWASSDASVATVSPSGLVTAVAVGAASVRAVVVDGGAAATCSVTVNPTSVTGVGINESALSLFVGGLFTLTETVLPPDATNRAVRWESSNPGVAGVSENGVVRALSVGSTEISATAADGGHRAVCAVTIAPAPTVPVTAVTLNKTSAKLAIDSVELLSAMVWPGHATNRGVRWSSSNSAVATVSDNGLVLAKAEGAATITATSLDNPEKWAACDIKAEPFFPDGIKVYVSGYVESGSGGHVATLWTNGNPQGLTAQNVWAQGESVYATAGNVYVGGYYQAGGGSTAFVSDNGNISALSTDGRVWSVFADGNDVYASGHIGSNAVVWKNGQVLHRLTTNAPNAWAESVFVHSGDVYAVGWVLDSSWTARAALWKNGGATEYLWNAGAFSRAHSVFVRNGDVYVVGVVTLPGDRPQAMLWKNGARFPFTDGNGWADPTSVFVTENGDVYVTGHEENEFFRGVATVWKNGEMLWRLSDGENNARGESIFVLGDDVYVAGYDSVGSEEEGSFLAVLWKNDVRLGLSDGSTWAEALSVFVRRD